MGPLWFKKLLETLKPEVSLLKSDKIEINNVHVGREPAAPTITHNPATGELKINLSGMTPEQIKATAEILKDGFFNRGQTFVEKTSSDTILEVRKVEAKNQEILDALKPFVSADDHMAVRAALFLRDEYQAGKNVNKLKHQMVTRFGKRGANIANLCSAGYLDGVPDQIEKARQSPGFAEERLRKWFDLFVAESAFAVFVKAEDNETATRKFIVEKITTNASYGIHRLVIHGIGKDNLNKIRKVVDELLATHPQIQKQTEDQIGEAISIQITFTPDVIEKLSGSQKK
ncbi:MAG TPA: hypothetical protein VN915_01830 [Elusimicrobiota bacterium]|nr:hypothetical protein [Elusimicrobiota bacterium]